MSFMFNPCRPCCGGGTSTSDYNCLCCDAMVCASDSDSPITTCGSCPDGATTSYMIDVGDWTAYPLLGGVRTVYHTSGCTWEGESVEITVPGDPSAVPPTSDQTGTYKWVLTQAGNNSTFQLVWVMDDNPLDLGGDNEVLWVALTPWSCRCIAPMRAVNGHRFPSPSGLRCQICVTPTPVFCAGGSTPPLCLRLEVSGFANSTRPGADPNSNWELFNGVHYIPFAGSLRLNFGTFTAPAPYLIGDRYIQLTLPCSNGIAARVDFVIYPYGSVLYQSSTTIHDAFVTQTIPFWMQPGTDPSRPDAYPSAVLLTPMRNACP